MYSLFNSFSSLIDRQQNLEAWIVWIYELQLPKDHYMWFALHAITYKKESLPKIIYYKFYFENKL